MPRGSAGPARAVVQGKSGKVSRAEAEGGATARMVQGQSGAVPGRDASAARTVVQGEPAEVPGAEGEGRAAAGAALQATGLSVPDAAEHRCIACFLLPPSAAHRWRMARSSITT